MLSLLLKLFGVGFARSGHDGSYISTEFLVLSDFFPLFPVASKRVSATQNSDYAVYDGKSLWVYETTGVNRRQALCVYLWLASLAVPFAIYTVYADQLAKRLGSEYWRASVMLTALALVAITPLALRANAKRRLRQACELVKRGQDPGSRYSFLVQSKTNGHAPAGHASNVIHRSK